MEVVVQGSGIGARCCSHLLGAAGVSVAMQPRARASVPAVMVGDATQALICDVFEKRDLFSNCPRIRQRIVAWGRESRTVALPHEAVVISEEELCERLGLVRAREAAGQPDWRIIAARPVPESATEHGFGTRIASVLRVRRKPGSAEDACWIESLDRGWLFLLPGAGDSGWLLAVGGTADELLGRSRVVAEQIDALGGAAREFPAYPRILDPLCGPGWLACGTAALAFDPLCGDGTGNAIREAILASAVIRAVAKGGDVERLLEHYSARLVAGFRKHLEHCQEFYRTGGAGEWWRSELSELTRGLEWCSRRLPDRPSFRYRLKGFELE